jgi:hypothetical protein
MDMQRAGRSLDLHPHELERLQTESYVAEYLELFREQEFEIHP